MLIYLSFLDCKYKRCLELEIYNKLETDAIDN